VGTKALITPCFGARLVQEGNRLHFLADRAGFNGAFSDEDALHLDQAFPLILKQLELMLTSGELSPAISTASLYITMDSPAKPIRLEVWLCVHRHLS
jgi:hypothetical protein